MGNDLTILLGLTLVWLAAGLLTDGLSGSPTTRRLRRRSGLLLGLVWAGLLGAGAVVGAELLGAGPGLVAAAGPALLLPAGPAMVVAVRTVGRLRRLRAAAGAFSTSPDTPIPPALRAAAAHPLVVLPVQLTGLLAIPAIGTTLRAVGESTLPVGPATVGLVITAIALVAVTTGVRHALRHSRLEERAVTLRTAAPRAGGLLQV